jgi:hypothetical protein
MKNARAAFKWSFANEIDPKGWNVSHANMVSYRRSVPYTDVAVTGAVLVGSDDEEPLALQLSFCFEVRTLSDRLVSSAPQ